jgi:hypothetical protein
MFSTPGGTTKVPEEVKVVWAERLQLHAMSAARSVRNMVTRKVGLVVCVMGRTPSNVQ